ncbi:unnamed protein product [Closterium sp. NIES-65]|nr:unnamed protein product [Closterium sp. NIES-65]
MCAGILGVDVGGHGTPRPASADRPHPGSLSHGSEAGVLRGPLAGASLAPCSVRPFPCSLQVRPLLLAGASPCSLQVRPFPCSLQVRPLLLAGASLAPCSSTHLPHAAVPPYAVVLPCDWSSVLVCFCAPAHRHFMGTLTFLSALTAGYLPPATIAAAFLLAPVTSLAHLSSPIAHEAAKLDLDRVICMHHVSSTLYANTGALPHSLLSPLLLIYPLPAAPHLSSLVSSPFSSPLYVALLSPFSFSLPLSAPLSSPSLPSPPAGESNAPARVQPAQVSAARGVLRGECCEGSAARGVLQGECCKGSAACTSPRGTSPRGTSPHGTPPCATHLAARDLACPSCASPSCGHALGELVVASACASPRINCSSLLSAFTGMHPTTSPPPH